MKRNCIALIIIIMISVGGAFHLPAIAAKPAADKSEKAEYEQRIEQLEKVVQQKNDSITLLNQQMKLAEYVEKKADRNMDITLTLFAIIMTLVSGFMGIGLPLIINNNQRKKLDETATRSEKAADDLAKLETKLQDYSKQAEKSVQEANDSAQEAKAFTFFMQALKEEDLDRKIIRYSQAIKINPNYAMAYYNRGNAYDDKDEYDKAIEDYTKAIEINPNDAGAYNNRGVAYYNKGENDKAIEDLTKAIEINPNDADAYNNRGVAYSKMGETDKAIADYDKAIEINPNYAKAYNNRGNAYVDKGDCDKAIEDYSNAIEINPNYAEAYSNRGIAYTHKGNYDKAIEDYNKAIEINPDYARAYSNRGDAYYNKGEYDKAFDDSNRAIQIDPNDAVPYNNRGEAEKAKAEMLEKDGKLAEALGLFKKAVEDFDKFLELWTKDDDNRKNAIQLKQQCKEAIWRLEEELKNPTDSKDKE